MAEVEIIADNMGTGAKCSALDRARSNLRPLFSPLVRPTKRIFSRKSLKFCSEVLGRVPVSSSVIHPHRAGTGTHYKASPGLSIPAELTELQVRARVFATRGLRVHDLTNLKPFFAVTIDRNLVSHQDRLQHRRSRRPKELCGLRCGI